MKVSPLLLSLTDVFDDKVLALSLRFKLYLKTSFPKEKNATALTPSLEMTPVIIFLNELSSVNDDICFRSNRAFLILLLPYVILALPLSYSKINVISFLQRD